MSILPSIIVPARLASHRFPEKLLAPINGFPLILHTARNLKKEAPEFEVFFAVDGEKIGKVLRDDGHQVILTDPDLSSGTDRIAFANETLGRKFIINVQADEPMVQREHIMSLVASLQDSSSPMATLATPFDNFQDYQDPNKVKVVLNQKSCALYFSRLPIPHVRDREACDDFSALDPAPLKHLGMYGYEQNFLREFSNSTTGKLEKLEKLEQLRALEMGYPIKVSIVAEDTIGVDLPEDLLKISALIENTV
jgi:3-deoxy-manno-octulosonate cytidylyltransferase (CMP-KDO synthetase)